MAVFCSGLVQWLRAGSYALRNVISREMYENKSVETIEHVFQVRAITNQVCNQFPRFFVQRELKGLLVVGGVELVGVLYQPLGGCSLFTRDLTRPHLPVLKA